MRCSGVGDRSRCRVLLSIRHLSTRTLPCCRNTYDLAPCGLANGVAANGVPEAHNSAAFIASSHFLFVVYLACSRKPYLGVGQGSLSFLEKTSKFWIYVLIPPPFFFDGVSGFPNSTLTVVGSFFFGKMDKFLTVTNYGHHVPFFHPPIRTEHSPFVNSAQFYSTTPNHMHHQHSSDFFEEGLPRGDLFCLLTREG